MIIDDGKGKGSKARVDGNNRFHTQAVVETESQHALEVGDSYNLSTGLISITGDSTLIYIKNNDAKEFIVEAVALGAFEGITHSDDPYITIIKNPTGGDLITDATAVDINENRNFGSSLTLDGNIYKGKVAGTITGGSDIAILQVTPGGRSFYTIGFVLPKGASMAIKLTANVSSGSANYYAAIIGHLKDQESKD
jgi:hypothetical protein